MRTFGKYLRFLLLFLSLVPGASGQEGAPLTLNTDIAVSGKVITLGDVFSGLEGALKNRSTQVVANAPQPGKSLTLSYTWLRATALKYQLPWEPASKFDQVTVKRTSQPLSLDPIQGEILRRIQESHPGQEFLLTLDKANFALHVGTDDSTDMTLEDLAYDPRTEKFQAQLVLAAYPNQSIRITGYARTITQTPVLTRVVGESEIITAQDVAFIPFPNRLLPKGALLSTDTIQGMQPRRILPVNQPLTTQDLKKPQTIKKGALVTARLKNKNMVLTVKGIAQDNGALGETIRIQNSTSQKILSGIITGPDTVDVGE